jgi:hypothetical protein
MELRDGYVYDDDEDDEREDEVNEGSGREKGGDEA